MFYWTIHLKKGHSDSFHAAVVVGKELYSFGGYNNFLNTDQMEVHIFNTVCLCWRKLAPVTNGRGECSIEVPSGRCGHTAVLVEKNVYIWGGECNVLYAFDVGTHSWFKPNISGTIPKARIYHSACVLGNVMFIYGGFSRSQQSFFNDCYKLDTTTMVWALINTKGTPPRFSSYHSANIIGTKMFVFGGKGPLGVIYNNIRVFDTETNRWISMPSAFPKGRGCHSSFAYNGVLYIFGGLNFKENVQFNDLWKFSPETFSWKKVKPKGKGPCTMYAMCCCIVGDNMIIFGGYKESARYDDHLYMLDLNPSLKTLCKRSVIRYRLDQSKLPHDIKWELETMT